MSSNDNNQSDGGDLYRPYDPFNYNTFPFAPMNPHPLGLHALDHSNSNDDNTAFDPSPMTFTDCLHVASSTAMDHYNSLSTAFDVSCSAAGEIPSPSAANSSISSSSNDASAAVASDSGNKKSSVEEDHNTNHVALSNAKESDGGDDAKSSKKL